MKRHLAWQVPVVALALFAAGCSSNDAGSGTDTATSAATTSASAAAAPNPLAETAATEYKAYAVAQIDELVGLVKVFTDAVRAGDLKAAQDAYAPSRAPWERIEPLAGLVEEIDGKVDARVDDFAGVDDPDVHRLAPPRVPAVREEHHRGRRPVRRSARQGHRHAEGASSRRSR